eukprot:92002-Chlamydomonas_euryale.AAC.1
MSSRTTAPPPHWAASLARTTKTSVREYRMSRSGRPSVPRRCTGPWPGPSAPPGPAPGCGRGPPAT